MDEEGVEQKKGGKEGGSLEEKGEGERNATGIDKKEVQGGGRDGSWTEVVESGKRREEVKGIKEAHKSGRKPEVFHESRESPPVWGTRNFTACSKRSGTSLGRSSGESPRLGRCVQVEKTKRLDWCAAIAGALPPQPQGRCGLGLSPRLTKITSQNNILIWKPLPGKPHRSWNSSQT
ncbi:hypothetical protein PoB_003367000 [Plakobranchus ocellatus]|uniref:Uncharacterized protein n=1 Tax=Plakobranchus ocellatus TaxID=259542 RepID=A0AAV4AG75_9GAST|nr:hypothetical protein PoB_003367000 [Plakobranchus ocellatus]